MNDMTDTAATLDEAPPRRLVRVDEGRWLGGVCEGLGRYFDISPVVYRIAFAALAFVGGTGVLLYLAAWLVIPHETQEESIAVEALRTRREQPWLLVGVGLLAVAAILLVSETDIGPGEEDIWFFAAVAGAALVIGHVVRRQGAEPAAPAAGGDSTTGTTRTTAVSRPPAPPEPRRPSLFLPVVGALLAGAGIVGLLDVADVWDVSMTVAFAIALAFVGVAIAVGAAAGYRVGGLVPIGLVLLAGFVAAVLTPVSISAGVGNEVERPLDATQIESKYELGVGNLTIDLRNVDLPPGTTSVAVALGVGEVVVTVPENAALDIDGHTGIGKIAVLGEVDDGTDVDEQVFVPGPTPSAPVLELEADVGIGDLQVVRG